MANAQSPGVVEEIKLATLISKMRVLYFSGRMPDENSGGGSSNLPGTTKKWGSPSNFITLTGRSRSRWTKCGEPFDLKVH